MRKCLDAAGIDKLVLACLKATDADLEADAEKLQINEVPLEDKTLYLCLWGDDKGQSLTQEFNSGLELVDSQAIIGDCFAQAFSR